MTSNQLRFAELNLKRQELAETIANNLRNYGVNLSKLEIDKLKENNLNYREAQKLAAQIQANWSKLELEAYNEKERRKLESRRLDLESERVSQGWKNFEKDPLAWITATLGVKMQDGEVVVEPKSSSVFQAVKNVGNAIVDKVNADRRRFDEEREAKRQEKERKKELQMRDAQTRKVVTQRALDDLESKGYTVVRDRRIANETLSPITVPTANEVSPAPVAESKSKQSKIIWSPSILKPNF